MDSGERLSSPPVAPTLTPADADALDAYFRYADWFGVDYWEPNYDDVAAPAS